MIVDAHAVRDAVKLAGERGYLHVETEPDAQEVVKLMNECGIGSSEIASIVQKVKELSSFSFPSFSITFVGRHANEAAYRCANRVSAGRRRCLWLNYTPRFLEDILENDCNISE